MTIRIGIMGYGNLGRGIECAVKHNPDMELAAVFTRRDPEAVKILTDSPGMQGGRDRKLAGKTGRCDSLRRKRHGSACADT